MSPHVALLGDSVFDNKAYAKGKPEVAAHLRALLPTWKVTLLGTDGSTTESFGKQLDRVADSVTHIVLSLGGNDALHQADLLDLPIRTTGEALDVFEERVGLFEVSYGYAVEAVLALGKATTVCTIYNGQFDEPTARRARMGVAMFDDAILRTALRFGLDAIELRLVCTEATDFANPIEPSGTGGRKIAQAIAGILGAPEPLRQRSTISAG